MTLPSKELLTQIQQHILSRSNKPEESKKAIHYGLFLLCFKSGLRVSETLNFDLTRKNKQGLYKITPTKKQKERYVYISPQVISELKKHNWKPNQTNRFNFYHFLKRVKQELNISPQIELTPHTLRRCFATYHAQAGMPLPLLQKILGHKSIRTTALYWMNIYQKPEQNIKPPQDDIADILCGKEWLDKHENKKPPQPEPLMVSEISELGINPNPPATQIQVSPSPIKENFSLNEPESQWVQPLVSNEPQPKKEPLPTEPKTQEEPKLILTEISAEKTGEQGRSGEPLKPIINEPNPEQVLLNKVQQLERKLNQLQAENKQLKTEKEQAEALAKAEKQRADYYESQLKTIARSLCQWQKINYYQQKFQAEQKCQIVQAERPLPFRLGE